MGAENADWADLNIPHLQLLIATIEVLGITQVALSPEHLEQAKTRALTIWVNDGDICVRTDERPDRSA